MRYKAGTSQVQVRYKSGTSLKQSSGSSQDLSQARSEIQVRLGNVRKSKSKRLGTRKVDTDFKASLTLDPNNSGRVLDPLH